MFGIKKSYIGAVVFGVLGIAHGLGWITTEQLTTFGTISGAFFGFSIRHAIAKGK